MCTVTYLPLNNNNFLLTSNRDVSILREQATLPMLFDTPNGKVLYPVDGQAGGTWVGLNEQGKAVVLLNGGFENHEYNPPYTRSRGGVVKALLENNDHKGFLTDCVLTGVEPFTLLLLDWTQGNLVLWEFVWDGERKFFKQLDETQPHIYSSATLYDSEMREKRQGWFAEWLQQHPNYSQSDILDFHETAGDGDPWTSVMLNRGNVQTVSVTSIQKNETIATVFYHDTLQGTFSNTVFETHASLFIEHQF
jgi:hypothetical protein